MIKIAIIGCGQATFGFLHRITQREDLFSHVKIDVFDQNSFGNSGLQYDGKMVIGDYAGTDQFIDLEIQQHILSYYLAQSGAGSIDPYAVEQHIDSIRFSYYDFYKNGLYVVPQYTYHLGTDQLSDMNKKVINNLKSLFGQNLNFKFNTLVTDDQDFTDYDYVVYAVGRHGTTLLNQFKTDPVYVESNNKVDLGIRLEVPSNLPDVLALDTDLYEWKIRYKTSNNTLVRTFCHNPNGYVTMQNTNVLGDQIQIVNGHSYSDRKSSNTNLAILATHTFTQPFNDSVLYGKIVSQLANLLAGGNRVILQTLGDFINKKRTKKLFRVLPTLSPDKYTLGDLSFVFPDKTYNSIVQFIDVLSKNVPSVRMSDNLIYGVQTKFYGMKLNNFGKIAFIGDCSGRSRSIIAATCHGYLTVDELFPA